MGALSHECAILKSSPRIAHQQKSPPCEPECREQVMLRMDVRMELKSSCSSSSQSDHAFPQLAVSNLSMMSVASWPTESML